MYGKILPKRSRGNKWIKEIIRADKKNVDIREGSRTKPLEHECTTLANDGTTPENNGTTLEKEGTILRYDGLAFDFTLKCEVKGQAIIISKGRTVVARAATVDSGQWWRALDETLPPW